MSLACSFGALLDIVFAPACKDFFAVAEGNCREELWKDSDV